MPLLAYGEYRPDVSDYEGQASRVLSKSYTPRFPTVHFLSPAARRRDQVTSIVQSQ